jgi:hypothetical protein
VVAFTCYRSEMLKHSSEKLHSIRKGSEMNVKAAENPKFSVYHSSFPSRNDFLIKVPSEYRCRWGFFRAKFSMEMKAAQFCFDVYFAFYFPHMKYGKYWFHLQKDFLYLKNEFRAKKKFPSVTRRCRPCRGFLDEI